MRIRLRFSVRTLLIVIVLGCLFFGYLTNRNSRRTSEIKSLQDQGVILDMERQSNLFAKSVSLFFPAAYLKPKRACVCYKYQAPTLHLGDKEFPHTEAEKVVSKLIREIEAVGFSKIIFAKITPRYGFVPHSRFDLQVLFPTVGDGRFWVMPPDDYSAQLAVNRETFGLKRVR